MTTNRGPISRTAWPARTRLSSPVSSLASLSLSTRPSIRFNSVRRSSRLGADLEVHRVGHRPATRPGTDRAPSFAASASRWPRNRNLQRRYVSGSTGLKSSNTFSCRSSVSRSFMLARYLPRQRNVLPPGTTCKPGGVDAPRLQQFRVFRRPILAHHAGQPHASEVAGRIRKIHGRPAQHVIARLGWRFHAIQRNRTDDD